MDVARSPDSTSNNLNFSRDQYRYHHDYSHNHADDGDEEDPLAAAERATKGIKQMLAKLNSNSPLNLNHGQTGSNLQESSAAAQNQHLPYRKTYTSTQDGYHHYKDTSTKRNSYLNMNDEAYANNGVIKMDAAHSHHNRSSNNEEADLEYNGRRNRNVYERRKSSNKRDSQIEEEELCIELPFEFTATGNIRPPVSEGSASSSSSTNRKMQNGKRSLKKQTESGGVDNDSGNGYHAQENIHVFNNGEKRNGGRRTRKGFRWGLGSKNKSTRENKSKNGDKNSLEVGQHVGDGKSGKLSISDYILQRMKRMFVRKAKPLDSKRESKSSTGTTKRNPENLVETPYDEQNRNDPDGLHNSYMERHVQFGSATYVDVAGNSTRFNISNNHKGNSINASEIEKEIGDSFTHTYQQEFHSSKKYGAAFSRSSHNSCYVEEQSAKHPNSSSRIRLY